MNFIIQSMAYDEFTELDSRLKSTHNSLYYALFHCWNRTKFINTFSVPHTFLKRRAGFGNSDTLIKKLENLDSWGYLKYKKGSNGTNLMKITMYEFPKDLIQQIQTKINESSDFSLSEMRICDLQKCKSTLSILTMQICKNDNNISKHKENKEYINENNTLGKKPIFKLPNPNYYADFE